jgi:hypothetical protein
MKPIWVTFLLVGAVALLLVGSQPQLMPFLPVIGMLIGIVSLLGLRPHWRQAGLGEWARPSLYLGLLLFIGTFVIAATILLPGVEENPALAGAIINTAATSCIFGIFLLIASLMCWFANRFAK